MSGEKFLASDGFPKDSRSGGMRVAVAMNEVGHELWTLFRDCGNVRCPITKGKDTICFFFSDSLKHMFRAAMRIEKHADFNVIHKTSLL